MKEKRLTKLEAEFYNNIRQILKQMEKEKVKADYLHETILEYVVDWEMVMKNKPIEARAHFSVFMLLFFDHPVFFNNIRHKCEKIDKSCQKLFKCYKKLSKAYKEACGVDYNEC